MAIPVELLPVVQITLPILGGMFIASWVQNRSFDLISKRIDDTNKRMDDGFKEVIKRLDSIDSTLKEHGERITRLEERIPPLVRR